MRKLLLLLGAALAAAAFAAAGAQGAQIVVYGTSDVTDSNLLAGLIQPGFAKVDPDDTIAHTASGSGAAISGAEMSANHVDLVLVHSPALEAPYVAGGNSLEPLGRALFYNDYVIVGPKSDPAGVLANDPHDAVGAYERIAQAGAAGTATFVSREDASGTNVAEQQIWNQTTGVTLHQATNSPTDPTRQEPWDPTANGGAGAYPSWYQFGANKQGLNLDATNTCAAPKVANGCYTMVDRGTYLFAQGQGRTNNLEIVSQNNSADAVGGASELTNPFHGYLNQYGNNQAGAKKLLDYLTSPAFQSALLNFPGNGQTAVFPDAFATISQSSIPTTAAANTKITINATLQYAPPVAQPIYKIPVQLQSSPTPTVDSSWTNVGTPVVADASGNVSFSPTIGASTTYYRLSMDTFDSTTLASRFSANTNNALGSQSGRVDVPVPVPVTPSIPSVITPPPATKPPSNIVGFGSIKAASKGAFSLPLKFPGAGTVTITGKATYKGKKISVFAQRKVKALKAGTVTVHVQPGVTGRSALKHARKLKVTLTVTFLPTGAGATKHTRTTHVTVRL